MSGYLELMETALAELDAGRAVVMAGVLSSSGSSPRGAGAHMLVLSDGRTMGTIGGGAVEFAAAQRALSALHEGQGAIESYSLTKGEIADIGMICGGSVLVCFELYSPNEPERVGFLAACAELMRKNADAWVVRRVENGSVTAVGLFDGNGMRLLVGAIDECVLAGHFTSSAVCLKGEVSHYIEPISQSGRVYLFGGGHVGRALVPVLSSVGFSVVVLDDRPSLALRERFPLADEVRLCDFCSIDVDIGPRDYVVIMTPAHQADYAVLEQVLRTPARYIGCIGSRHKVALTREKLLAAGFTEEDHARVHSTIGLPIGGETPQEIAISIAAEMIMVRSGKTV